MTFVLVSVLYKHVCDCIDDPFCHTCIRRDATLIIYSIINRVYIFAWGEGLFLPSLPLHGDGDPRLPTGITPQAHRGGLPAHKLPKR